MKHFASEEVRNVCVVGAQGDGKTTVAEALLFNAGTVARMGSVAEGTTTGDYADDEIERRISINLSSVFFEHRGVKVNLLLAPGYADFISEMYAGLAVADAAVLVIAADTGVSPTVESIWEYLQEKKIPTIIFLNKIDRKNTDFAVRYKELKEKLGPLVVDVVAPDAGGTIGPVVNLLDERVPEIDRAFRDTMVEDIASGDDALTDEFLGGTSITREELVGALRKEFRERKTVPLLCGSAVANSGIRELADFIVDYVPAPQAGNSTGSFAAFVFKTMSEPGTGQVNLIKVLSGTLAAGREFRNLTRSSGERAGQLCFVCGKRRIDADSVQPGDLAALLKMKDVRTNDMLGDEKADAAPLHIDFPPAVYSRAIVACRRDDEEKVGTAMAAMTMENPGVRHYYDPETRETVVAGQGALQLDILARRIKARYGIEVELHPPRILYRETIRGSAEAQGKYKRQSGGRGQYGDCWLKIEPLERGRGYEFIDRIVGGAIPRNYIPAIEKGVREAMGQGVIGGYPVVDIRVTLFDGSYHEVDSSDMAFKIAAAMAFRTACAEARPVLLEPVMDVEIVIPEEYTGVVMGDLNARRGKVQGMDKAGRRELIRAQIPLSEMYVYATDLRSLTKGSGRFSMKHSHYEVVLHDRAKPTANACQKAASV
jgi:elongation factor G